MTIALMVAVLVAGGVYLLLQRGLIRIVFGFALLSHAANLTLMATGVTAHREAPFAGDGASADMADALPPAFVLTSIVISFAVTVYLFVLAIARVRGRGDDPDAVEDDDTVLGGDAS